MTRIALTPTPDWAHACPALACDGSLRHIVIQDRGAAGWKKVFGREQDQGTTVTCPGTGKCEVVSIDLIALDLDPRDTCNATDFENPTRRIQRMADPASKPVVLTEEEDPMSVPLTVRPAL